MNPSKSEIDLALLDVRKAYRLLYDYQRAVLDAAKYIGARLELPYAGGYAYFSEYAPKEGRGSLDNSAWDWLNLIFYEFFFEKEIRENEFLRLSIWSFADTGYFISENPAAEKTDIGTFTEVENSGTKVGFLVYRAWKDEFNKFKDKDVLRRFLENDGELPVEFKGNEIVGKCCDFSRLSDETSTENLITELVLQAKSNGFPLELGKSAV